MFAQRLSHLLNPHFSRCLITKSQFFSSSSNHSSFAHKSWIFLIQNCKSIYQLKQIQTQIFCAGLCHDKHIIKKVMVFCTDPFVGNLDYAERIFNSIQNPCLFIYNVMIKGITKKGRLKECLLFFNRLMAQGLLPDNFTYPFVFKAIGGLGDELEGEKVYGIVVKTGMEFDGYVCNSLMDMFAELGKVGCMQKVFDEMPERDLVSWNVLISRYVKCMRFEDAVKVFQLMKLDTDLMPDEATVVSTLSACAALKRLELGKEINRYVCEELEFSTIIGNALIDMYCKCGCLVTARKLFDEMPMKNVNCWTSMVSGYVNYAELDEAKELFDKSPVKDIVLWTAMINGFVQFNCFDEAVTLFREMQNERIKPDKFTLVALLTGCANLGALHQGKWIHGYIDEYKIRMDAVVGTALIEMYAKCGCINKAMEVFNGLKEKDAAAWTSIICGLAMNGKTSKSLEMFSEMTRVGGKPDDITFIGVLSACSHGGLVEKGREFFNSMIKIYHIKPKLEHYGCLIDLFGRAGLLDEAEKLIEKVPDNSTNEITIPLYGALLSASRIHGNTKMGERVVKGIKKIGFSSDSSVHTLLANLYAADDRWDDVTKVRRKMKDLGVKKLPGCSLIEINGIVHEFLVGDISHPEIEEIYFVLQRMTKLLLHSKEQSNGNRHNIVS